jgi:hypothetical protein
MLHNLTSIPLRVAARRAVLERLSGKFYRIEHAHLQLANRPPLARSVAMFVACIALAATLDVVIFSKLYTRTVSSKAHS